jgi:hypothetical protein
MSRRRREHALAPTLIVLRTSVIDKQPGERRGGRSWVTELRFARRPNMIEVANGTLYLRANVGKLFERGSVHFDARGKFAPRGRAPDHDDTRVAHQQPLISAMAKEKRKEVAGGLGFEPRLAESESAVLPLDDPPPGLKCGS